MGLVQGTAEDSVEPDVTVFSVGFLGRCATQEACATDFAEEQSKVLTAAPVTMTFLSLRPKTRAVRSFETALRPKVAQASPCLVTRAKGLRANRAP